MAYTPYQPYDWETGEVITEGKLDHIEEGLVAAGEQIAENESDIAELNEQMPTKASIGQSYSDLGSGYTTTLKPTKYNKDEQPYLFRKALGARLTSEKIVGATVAWNQLVQNGDFASTDGWAIVGGTINGVANNVMDVSFSGSGSASYQITRQFGYTLPAEHYYWSTIDVKIPNTNNVLQFFGGSGSASKLSNATTDWQTIAFIWKTNPQNNLILRSYSGDAVEHIQLRNCMVLDLTLAFGTTIADHIYALEQAQAGAGVAFLRNNGFMTKDYYPYCAESLESVMTSGHRTVGFNAFDKSAVTNGKYIDANGSILSDVTIAISDYISVVPDTIYYVRETGVISLMNLFANYDADKNFLGWSSSENSNTHLRKTFKDAAYIRINLFIAEIDAQCINLSSDRNGEYEPYEEHTYPLSPVSLRGIMTLSDGKLKNDGDERYPDGTVKRRYAEVDLGTLDWTYQSAVAVFSSDSLSSLIAGVASHDYRINAICDKYVAVTENQGYLGASKCISETTWGQIRIRDSAYTDAATFKQMLIDENVKLVYELATPTTETTDPYQSEQTCSEYGTEAFIDERDVPIPVGHVTKYWPDLTAKIEALPDVTAIAPTENGSTASQAYTAGQYFFRNNEFCKAKTNIASGATFTLGTNYETTTIAAELYAAINS